MNRRQKDSQWQLNLNADGTVNTDNAQLAVLMDLRDELKKLNRVFECVNFLEIPQVLRTIARNTKPKVRARKVAK